MKKSTKSLLITALILVCTGLALTLGTLLYATIQKIDVFGGEAHPFVSVDKKLTLAQILSDSPESDYVRKLTTEPYKRIEVVSYVGKVEVKPTDGETYVTLTGANPDNILVQIIGSTLTVSEQEEVSVMGLTVGKDGFTFHGLRHLFGAKNAANSGKVMTVYLNQEKLPDTVSVRSTMGDVIIDSISGASLSVSTTTGSVKLNRLTFDRISLDIAVGTLFVTENRSNSLSASVRIGKAFVSLSDAAVNSAVVDLWIGNCEFRSGSGAGRYKLNLQTTLGAVYENGSKLGGTLQEYAGASNRVSSTVLIGKISVDGLERTNEAPSTERETGETETTDLPMETKAD